MEEGSDYQRLAADLIVKAYEHHKQHARFEETQRSWILTAYLTFTGLVYVLPTQLTESTFSNVWTSVVVVHLVIGILMMIATTKLSAEFRRHFSRAEALLKAVQGIIGQEAPLARVLGFAWLETATLHEGGSTKSYSNGYA